MFSAPVFRHDSVLKLLQFFGVGSVEAWSAKYDRANVAWPHSPSSTSNAASLAAWLRLGELEAECQICEDYNQSRFMKSIGEI